MLQVKDNQATLHEALCQAFIDFADEDDTEPSLRRLRTVDHDHGRAEIGDYFLADVPADLPGADDWTELRSMGMVLRTRPEGESISEAVAFSISSLPAQVQAFARAVRGPWGIENRPSDYYSSDVWCATGSARYHSRRGLRGVGRMVGPASWPRRRLLPFDESCCTPPRPSPRPC